jgi:hypothetical protein
MLSAQNNQKICGKPVEHSDTVGMDWFACLRCVFDQQLGADSVTCYLYCQDRQTDAA